MVIHKEVARGRNNQAIAEALRAMTQVMMQANAVLQVKHNNNQNGGVDEFRGLEKF